MRVMLADEAHDKWEESDIKDVRREGDSLVIVLDYPFFPSIIIGPFDEFAEKVVGLVE